MLNMLRKRWVQYFFGALGFLLVGFSVGLIVLEEIPPERPDRVVLNGGSPDLARPIALTDAAAIAEGWKDPMECRKTQQLRALRNPGKYFAREPEDQRAPYLLVYTVEGALLGIYFFSETQMPPPWEYQEAGLFTVAPMDFEHWGLHVHFQDWKAACGKFVARAEVLN